MSYIAANALAILLATAGGLVVGIVVDLATRTPAGPTGRPPFLLPVAILAEAWLAAILAGALILAPATGQSPWTMALASAVVIWIGFVLPSVAVSLLQAGHSARATIAHAAHWLAVMAVQAAILQAVGLVRPG